MSSIFISIASYRDPDLLDTINSAIKNCSNENQIHFGIVFQGTKNEKPDLSNFNNISMISMHPQDARGAGFARNKAMDLYENQDYYLQTDSHTQFVEDWDIKCINQLSLAQQTTDSKAIISGFPLPYNRNHMNSSINFQRKNQRDIRTYPTKQIANLRKDGVWNSIRVNFDNPENLIPEESNVVLAGFVFTYGDIVKDVPYDPEISFFGEELCFSARAWTSGYNIYSPKIPIIYHFYKREGYKKIWNDMSSRKVTWREIEKVSYEKQKRVLCEIEQSKYSIGKIRSMEDYEKLVGFDFKKHYNLTNSNTSSKINM